MMMMMSLGRRGNIFFFFCTCADVSCLILRAMVSPISTTAMCAAWLVVVKASEMRKLLIIAFLLIDDDLAAGDVIEGEEGRGF